MQDSSTISKIKHNELYQIKIKITILCRHGPSRLVLSYCVVGPVAGGEDGLFKNYYNSKPLFESK